MGWDRAHCPPLLKELGWFPLWQRKPSCWVVELWRPESVVMQMLEVALCSSGTGVGVLAGHAFGPIT